MDSLYLVVEYPYADIFEKWASELTDLDDVRLHDGIAAGDVVLRRGAHGYKLSVWDGDARLYLTERVEETLAGTRAEGQGMGMMLQLGPKWLRKYGDQGVKRLILNVYGQLAFFGLSDPEAYPIRLNRVDLTVDVLGLRVADFSIDQWRNDWVGYANKMHFHTSDTRDLQTVSIGSSSGAVRFKVYDKVAESKKKGSLRFWCSVWGVEESDSLQVARFEWSVKCYKANFSGMRYLSDLSLDGLTALLNYASLKWGRLAVPQAGDSNQSRWPLSWLWSEVRRIVGAAGWGTDAVAKREYDFNYDITDPYLNAAVGWLAGLMTRVGLERSWEKPASIPEMGQFLFERGFPESAIERRAAEKWKVASVLT